MAKGNTKKSFLDYFKLSDSSDDDFDDDLFDEDEDDYEDEDDMDDRLDDEYDDEDDYDAPQTESRVKASPLKSFNKYKGSASSDNGSARSKAARSSHGQQSGAGNGKLVSINSRSRAMDDSEVFVIKPDEFDDAQMIIDHLNRGQIIVINMEDLDLPTAQRIADFIGGASYAVDGLFQAISGNIFLATPNGTYVSGLSTKDVIQYLNQHGNVQAIEDMAAFFSVTPRTIRNHLRSVQDAYPACLQVGRGQVKLLKQIFEESSPSAQVPSSQQERSRYILRALLSRSEPMDLDELAASLFISEVTLQNEVKLIRHEIAEYHLSLRTKNNTLFISGSEKDKKRLMIHLIYNEAQHTLVSMETLHAIFPRYDIQKIRSDILACLNSQHFFIDEYSLTNLLLHMLITMDQLGTAPNAPRYEVSTDLIELNRHFVSIIDSICTELEREYGIVFTRSNKYQFTLLLMTRAVRNQDVSLPSRATLSIHPSTMRLVDSIVQAVKQVYDIDLTDIDFFIPFALHIDNMLVRIRQNVSVHNPLLHSIKAMSPIIYDIAVYISNLINHQEHVQLCEDEIAYIALHIGARIQDIYNRRGKLCAVLLCPQYYSYDHRQFDRLQSYFSDDLTIESVVTAPHELAGLKCDMILSTLPLTAEPPVVLISNFISSNDRQAISDVIHRLKAAREKERLISLLQTLIDADLFTPGADYADRESAIRTIGGQMCARGIVPQEFIESTLEREQISPTNFGMIAIPHPSDCRAARSAIAVSLLRKPLSWGTSSVRIIFMICVSKSDLSDFSDIFSYLPRVCSDYKTLEQLASASSYPDFIQILGGLCAE